MKTLMILYFLSLLLLFIKPTDYRDAYCGTYSVKRTHKHPNDQNTSLVYDVTSYTIVVSKNASDSIINVTTKEGLYSAKLISGAFKNEVKRIFGHFSNDSIYMECIPSLGPVSYKYVGKK